MQSTGLPDIFVEDNVGASARHVRRDRDIAGVPGVSDDFCFLLMIASIQNLMRDSLVLQQQTQCFRSFDGRRAHKNRPLGFDQSLYLVNDGIAFRILRLKNAMGLFLANTLLVRWDF